MNQDSTNTFPSHGYDKVGIMQPYFMPYLGYIGLIKHVDYFLLFDTVQFIRHGWIERNRILKSKEEWLYIKVPIVKNKGQKTVIKNVEVKTDQNWVDKLIAQLSIYKKRAPYYKEVVELLSSGINKEESSLVQVNKSSLEAICDYLGFSHCIEIHSELPDLDINPESVNAPDEWALRICEKIGSVKEYWNPPGGKEFFDSSKYSSAGINLKFHHQELPPYNQLGGEFIPGLSILDVMLFNSPEEINAMLDLYSISE